MVLPERFELSASPLPRECSTPELRQHLMDSTFFFKKSCVAGPGLILGAQSSRPSGCAIRNEGLLP